MSKNLKQFKNSSPDGKISLYLGSDKFSPSSSLDGIILVDRNRIPNGHKIWARFSGETRIASSNVVADAIQRRCFLNESKQLYPGTDVTGNPNLSEFQSTLMRELGPNALPFTFDVSSGLPPSVILYPELFGERRFNGVNYSLEILCGTTESSTDKKSTVCTEVNLIDPTTGEDRPPLAPVFASLPSGRGAVELEVSLDKQFFYHGEEVLVNVCLSNTGGKVVKKIRAWIEQTLETPFTTEKFRSVAIDYSKEKPSGRIAQITVPLKLGLEKLESHDQAAANGPFANGRIELAPTTPRRHEDGISVGYKVVVVAVIRHSLISSSELRAESPFVVGISESI